MLSGGFYHLIYTFHFVWCRYVRAQKFHEKMQPSSQPKVKKDKEAVYVHLLCASTGINILPQSNDVSRTLYSDHEFLSCLMQSETTAFSSFFKDFQFSFWSTAASRFWLQVFWIFCAFCYIIFNHCFRRVENKMLIIDWLQAVWCVASFIWSC